MSIGERSVRIKNVLAAWKYVPCALRKEGQDVPFQKKKKRGCPLPFALCPLPLDAPSVPSRCALCPLGNLVFPDAILPCLLRCPFSLCPSPSLCLSALCLLFSFSFTLTNHWVLYGWHSLFLGRHLGLAGGGLLQAKPMGDNERYDPAGKGQGKRREEGKQRYKGRNSKREEQDGRIGEGIRSFELKKDNPATRRAS